MQRVLTYTFLTLIASTVLSFGGVRCASRAASATAVSTSEPTRQYVTSSLGRTARILGPENAPTVRQRVNPNYPEEARRARTQGLVKLEVLIDMSGRVVDVTTIQHLPNGLAESAVQAVRQWRFEPITLDGDYVPALIDVHVNFKL